MEDQLLELEQLQRQLPQLEQATHSLEDMVGISDPQALTPPGPQGGASSPRNAALPLPERLEQAVAAASIVAACHIWAVAATGRGPGRTAAS